MSNEIFNNETKYFYLQQIRIINATTLNEGDAYDTLDRNTMGNYPNGNTKAVLGLFDETDDKIAELIFFMEIHSHVNKFNGNNF